MKALRRTTFEANSIIFHEGDIANCAYLLKSGRIEISTTNSGKIVHLTTVWPNQLFGELALIDAEPRSATAVAIEASEAVIISPDDIERQLDKNDEFMRYWVGYLTDRIRDLSKRVEK